MNPKDLVGSKKAPLGLVPPALEIGAAEAMENGAQKYGPFNWREKPIEFMSYLVAMKRHINALIDGEDNAPDTNIHHLKHIVAGGGILLDALYIPGGLIDNRPPKGPAAAMLAELDKSAPPHGRMSIHAPRAQDRGKAPLVDNRKLDVPPRTSGQTKLAAFDDGMAQWIKDEAGINWKVTPETAYVGEPVRDVPDVDWKVKHDYLGMPFPKWQSYGLAEEFVGHEIPSPDWDDGYAPMHDPLWDRPEQEPACTCPWPTAGHLLDCPLW